MDGRKKHEAPRNASLCGLWITHTKGSKYRFLILPRYEKDLEAVLQTKQKFNIKTVVTIATQILDILEYMHDKGFIHSDIKASNILWVRQDRQSQYIQKKL